MVAGSQNLKGPGNFWNPVSDLDHSPRGAYRSYRIATVGCGNLVNLGDESQFDFSDPKMDLMSDHVLTRVGAIPCCSVSQVPTHEADAADALGTRHPTQTPTGREGVCPSETAKRHGGGVSLVVAGP